MPNESPTQVVVIDDHSFMRELICRKLDSYRDGRFKVVAEGGDVRSAVQACDEFKPHLVILDINLPDGSGISAVAEIKKKCRGSRVLLCTAYVSDERVVEALNSGADGFVEKTHSWDEFVEAVERVSRGERYFYAQAAAESGSTDQAVRHDTACAKLACLSGREREVLTLVASGNSSKEVATRLGMSVGTVNVHRANLMKKLNTNNIARLVVFAFHAGLIS